MIHRFATFAQLPILFLFVLAVASGCAIGNTHTFNYQPQALKGSGLGSVVVLFSVADQRPDIVSGDEPPQWVGEQRGGYGTPFNVKTTSGKPFAEVVAETLHRDLSAAGFEVTRVQEVDAGGAGPVIRDQGAERGVASVQERAQQQGGPRRVA